ncbi:hypothetical protein C8R46DRAFT_1048297 [Mycena filopes]|nr:hypothetical protein C8R46DRAFT_1048297 [Mycena filopes]
MFLLAVLSVLGVVALGPQVVLGSFKFNISQVVQCEPVTITFSGNGANNHSVPTNLTILPTADNAAPIYIPIPNGASNSTGITLSFIPLPAGTRFLASLDNIFGQFPAVSDVTRVISNSSGTDNSDCLLPGFEVASVFAYTLDESLSQCEPFTVTHAPNVPPNITAFAPELKFGYPLQKSNSTSDTANSTSYVMVGVQGLEVLLVMNDGQTQQTTKLITIDGDSESSHSCLPQSSSGSSKGKISKTKSAAGLSRGAVLGIAIGAAIVVMLALVLLFYILRARRRNRRAPNMSFDPALLNQKWPPDLEERKIDPFRTPPVTARAQQVQQPQHFDIGSGAFVRDPIYTNEKYAGSIMSDTRASISSWDDQFVPTDRRNNARGQRGSVSSSRLSMNTLDVQDILQMATVHRDRASSSGATISHGRATPQPSTAGTNVTSFDVAKPAVARLLPMRRRTSDPPDMPVAVSRNNSASAALSGLPAGYGAPVYGGLPAFAPSSYASFGGDEEEGRLAGRPADGVDGIGGFPIPRYTTNNQRNTSDSWGNVGAQ